LRSRCVNEGFRMEEADQTYRTVYARC
jgi:hypothetical protein